MLTCAKRREIFHTARDYAWTDPHADGSLFFQVSVDGEQVNMVDVMPHRDGGWYALLWWREWGMGEALRDVLHAELRHVESQADLLLRLSELATAAKAAVDVTEVELRRMQALGRCLVIARNNAERREEAA